MSKEGKFLIFCIERYRYYKKLSGAQVAEHFEKHHICEYLMKYYEVLHTMGELYIVEDIEGYIEEQTARHTS